MSKSRKQNKVRKIKRKQNKVRKTQRKQNKFRKTLKGGARIWSEGYNHLKNIMKLPDEINVTIITNFNAIKDAVTGWSSVSRSKRRNMSIIEIEIVSKTNVSNNDKMYYLVTFEPVRIKKLKWILNDGFKIHSAYLLVGHDNKKLSQKCKDAKNNNSTLELTSSVPGAEIKIRNFNNLWRIC